MRINFDRGRVRVACVCRRGKTCHLQISHDCTRVPLMQPERKTHHFLWVSTNQNFSSKDAPLRKFVWRLLRRRPDKLNFGREFTNGINQSFGCFNFGSKNLRIWLKNHFWGYWSSAGKFHARRKVPFRAHYAVFLVVGWRRVIASSAVENGSARSAGSGPSGYFFSASAAECSFTLHSNARWAREWIN